MVWTAPRTWLAAEKLTAALLNLHLRDNLNVLAHGSWGRDATWARKSATETVTNSTVLQNDDTLLFTAAANGIYRFEVGALCAVSGGSSTSDIKFAWSLPSGSWSGGGNGPDVPMAATSSAGSGEWAGVVGAVGASISYGLDSDGVVLIMLHGNIAVGATGGTCNLQWAQNAAVAVNTDLRAGSWLYAQRVA